MSRPTPNQPSGILLLDKPENLSSAGLVARIKRITGAAKVGHAGTLDPFARGLMVCGINHGTRLSRFFLHGDKTYTATITYGSETDTLDCTGTMTRTAPTNFFDRHPDFFTEAHQTLLISHFLGSQEQTPPVYSALKHQGVPLYKLARKGTPVQKEARRVVIHSLELLDISPPSITVSVSCSAGTYIRSLAADIGARAGCGAHLSALVRTETCGFSLDQATDLDTLADHEDWPRALISMDRALPDMPEASVDDGLAARIWNGEILGPTDLATQPPAGCLKIVDKNRRVLALVEFDKSRERYNYCCVFHD
jgi:tRNA pseudouridine55 synthase